MLSHMASLDIPSQGKTVTFNPGAGADPVYYGWEGSPTVMSFENFYSR